jgi:hypothetical protein
MDDLPAPPMPSVSQSKSSHLNFFRTPVWNEEIFDRDGIRRLYESDQYPLARRATIGTRTAVE